MIELVFVCDVVSPKFQFHVVTAEDPVDVSVKLTVNWDFPEIIDVLNDARTKDEVNNDNIFCPSGLPFPVHKSHPELALYAPLFPVVISRNALIPL